MSAGNKKNKNKKNELTPIQLDIFILIMLAVSVLLFISAIGFCGLIGVGLRYIMFGLMGMPAYAFPIIVFLSGIYILVNKEKKQFKLKAVSVALLFILICALFQLIMIGYEPSYSVFQCFVYSADDHLGGGFIGGCIVQLLGTLIGVVGTYIVILIGMVILAILITQKPLASMMRSETKQAYKKAKESRTQAIEKKRIQEELERSNKKKTESLPEIDFKLTGDIPAMEETVSSDKEMKQNKEDIFDSYLDDKFNEKDEQDKEKPSSENVKNDTVKDVETSFSLDSNKVSKTDNYRFPPINLLKKGSVGNLKEQGAQVKETARKLQQTLNNFGVDATVVNVSCGPTVTRYEVQPDKGVKVSRIVGLTDDIKLNLAAADIRMEAPIPGKAAVGIEVPNKTNSSVGLRELLESREFQESKSKLTFAVGKDLAGRPVVSDIAKMPHLLIAGSTGSGKSVCINTLIMSIIYKARPDEVKLIMIDPKVVELSVYNGIPHLLSPVVTDPKKAAGALQWAVTEMTRRYNLFAEFGVRDIAGYNHKAEGLAGYENEYEEKPEILPQIVIIVDELADLMMTSPGEVEDAICRLAQLARAAGLHLIIATQRPSVNVITGLIKANMPSRIALSVTSGIDSRVIIDMNGAEKLLGRGDMLFYPSGYTKPARVQGGFVSDEEIQKVVDFISKKETVYDNSIQEAFAAAAVSGGGTQDTSAGDRDVYFTDAGKFIIEKDKASIGMLQRVFKIGFNRAARIMDQLCDAGVVGPEEGTKPRKILMTMEQFENYLEEN